MKWTLQIRAKPTYQVIHCGGPQRHEFARNPV